MTENIGHAAVCELIWGGKYEDEKIRKNRVDGE